MLLREVAMIAADTTRSRAYVQALAKHDLLPSHVLVLEDSSEQLLPGQLGTAQAVAQASPEAEQAECWSEAGFDLTLPIKAVFDEKGIVYTAAGSRNINDPAVVDAVKQQPEPVFIYSGFGGVILRRDILATGKRFLHVHGGYLPEFKGSTTNYYSLLLEGTLGASAIFMHEEIDCGPVLHRRKFPPPVERERIDHTYDSAARAKVLVATLLNHVETGRWDLELSDNSGGETYYIIHPVLKHLAILGTERA